MQQRHPTSLRSGRFSLVHSLGSGGMASVYRAYDHELRVWRAVKLLAPELGRSASIRTRFGAEAQTMAALEHANVIRVYDVGVEGDTPYIVMELAEGGCVSDWIDENGAMPTRMALDVVLQLCRGIHEAHSRGVIHRDVKPHNLLVDGSGRVKVTDFGIAQAARGDGNASLTRTGTVMGTLGFMAPEQRADAKNVDARADVYSIGATLFMLLTSRISMELFVADMSPEILDGVPDGLRPIIRKACAYKASDRYQRVMELARDLSAARREAPPLGDQTPSLVRPLKQVEPPKRLGAFGAVASSGRSPVAPRPIQGGGGDGSTFMLPPIGNEPTRLKSATEIEQGALDRLSQARTRMDRSNGEETRLAPTQWLDPEAKVTQVRHQRPTGPLTDLDISVSRGASILVHMECGPKRRHGGGRALDGSMVIQQMLGARRLGEALEEAAGARGLHPARCRGIYESTRGEGAITLYDVEVQTEDLDKYDHECDDCPARIVGQSYGCFVRLAYPIPARAEAWLMERLRLGGALGGEFCASMLSSNGFSGRELATYRKQGMFEARRPVSQVVKKGWLFNTSADSNQVFEALLLGGSDFLEPLNCLGMALWFGAVSIDGVGPSDLTDADLAGLASARTPRERLERTQLRLGERSDDPAIVSMQQVLRALYLAWVTNSRVLAEP